MGYNKTTIIVDKESVKPNLIWKFSGLDCVFMVAGYLVVYYPVKFFFNDFIGLIMGVAMFALVGVLLVEMPDHLSIIQHIQMWYNYRYKQPKEYFYIPKERTHGTVKTNPDEDSKEWLEYQNMIQENRLSNEN